MARIGFMASKEMFENVEDDNGQMDGRLPTLRGLFGKFMEFGHRNVKY